ncbi:type III secretion system chaperone [Verrucomicrobium sp. BvORR106]|uniref:type III secretion system chaperone n=1 Tax=Verrucomicrobium sp. BvORR106 TaxID=1403819 RepID=UPI00056DC959|nr:type III secretion system chaperone [Verrucomicrobium sp. BvORR106]
MFGAELGAGLRFGLDADAGEILAQTQVLLAEKGPEGFFEILEEFVSWAAHWQEQLAEEPAIEAMQNLPDDFSPFSFIRA